MSKETLMIRLLEQKRIYDKSPNTTVTYGDLSRVVEDLLEILEFRKLNGFKENE